MSVCCSLASRGYRFNLTSEKKNSFVSSRLVYEMNEKSCTSKYILKLPLKYCCPQTLKSVTAFSVESIFTFFFLTKKRSFSPLFSYPGYAAAAVDQVDFSDTFFSLPISPSPSSDITISSSKRILGKSARKYFN